MNSEQERSDPDKESVSVFWCSDSFGRSVLQMHTSRCPQSISVPYPALNITPSLLQQKSKVLSTRPERRHGPFPRFNRWESLKFLLYEITRTLSRFHSGTTKSTPSVHLQLSALVSARFINSEMFCQRPSCIYDTDSSAVHHDFCVS